jgi:hypothetical protein
MERRSLPWGHMGIQCKSVRTKYLKQAQHYLPKKHKMNLACYILTFKTIFSTQLVVEVFQNLSYIDAPIHNWSISPLVKNGGKQFYEYGFLSCSQWVGCTCTQESSFCFFFSFLFGGGKPDKTPSLEELSLAVTAPLKI